MSQYAIGIDIGGTRVKAVCATAQGHVLSEDLYDAGEDSWADVVREHVLRIEADEGPAKWVGISSPGLAAADGRSIAWMQGRMAGLQGFDWTKYLQRESLVPVLNDAHAALIGETWLGAASGCRNAVMLTLGTGVGGAVVCDGRLLRGQLGRAGHLGHLSLDPRGDKDIVNTPGSLEDAIGNHSVSKRSSGRFTKTSELLAAYRAGDELARKVWLESIRALAAGIASIINIVDPEVVIIGGGIANAGQDLFAPLAMDLDELEWRPTGSPVRIVPAELGEFAGAIGAARRAMQTSAS